MNDQNVNDKGIPTEATPIEGNSAAASGGDPGNVVREITIDFSNRDPELDPRDPQFDPEKWRQTVDTASESLLDTVAKVGAQINDAITPIAKAAALSDTVKAATGIAKMLNAAVPKMDSLTGIATGIASAMNNIRVAIDEMTAAAPEWLQLAIEESENRAFLTEELKKPQYEGKTIDDLLDEAETDEDGNPLEESLFMQAILAARSARLKKQQIVESQIEGREQRLQARKAAQEQGAIMELRGNRYPVFSERMLWDAFAPGRISKIGTLPPTAIDKDTGKLAKYDFEDGEIVQLHAMDISLNTFMLLNAIVSNMVENYRDEFIESGAIKFYVKGVIDSIDVDARFRKEQDDQQITFDPRTLKRKTAGALYIENQFKPLLTYIGTTNNGSRYSVLNYDGYDIDSDTMTIRTPYLFQLWKSTQEAFVERQNNQKKRIESGKRPLKKDLQPLAVNSLFKGEALKEDGVVLEIAIYITNILLNAGKTKGDKTKKTEIKYSTMIKNCPRFSERLTEIESRPNTEHLPDGKIRNNNAIYNTELRKIATAFNLIMNPEKCDALTYYDFIDVQPAKIKNGKVCLIPPTKKKLNGKIILEWQSKDAD